MKELLSEISAYCSAAGIATSTFGLRAVNDGGFVARLKAGGECLPRTAEKVRAYMRSNPPPSEPASADTAA